MGRRLLARWEALAPRHQVLVATPLALVFLFAVHEAFFPLLTWKRSLTYAVMECVPLALVVTFATQVELVRREQRSGDAAVDAATELTRPAEVRSGGDGIPSQDEATSTHHQGS